MGRLSRSEENGTKKYLVPLLLYGPNNQYSGFLDGLAIAKLTNRTLVLPKYFARWYRDTVSSPKVSFNEVFEHSNFSDYVDVALADDVRPLFQRKLQWTILASPVPKARLVDALDLLEFPCCPSKKALIPSHSRAKLVEDAFAKLTATTFVCLAPLFVLDGEKRLLLEAAEHRVRSQRIRSFASLARTSLFGSAEAVLAVHIRRESTDLGCDDRRRYIVCPDLMDRGVSTREIIAAILSAANEARVHHIYLAHAGNGPPELEREPSVVMTALQNNGLHVASASTTPAMIRAINTSVDPFDVSLIEQELCASLTVFLPSARSTWSATVTIDREARSLRVLRPIDANRPVVPL